MIKSMSIFFFHFVLACCVLLSSSTAVMSEQKPLEETPAVEAAPAEEPTVHIVYTLTPEGVEPEAHHISTLASVVGSEDAAKDALVYSYKTAASGFSAKLTTKQVEEISKHPDVLQVVPDRTLQLHSGVGTARVL